MSLQVLKVERKQTAPGKQNKFASATAVDFVTKQILSRDMQ